MNDTALQMADELDRLCDPYDSAIATELRRLHAENEDLKRQLHSVDTEIVLRRQRDEIAQLHALNAELVEALRKCDEAMAWELGGEPLDTLMVDARNAARAALAKWEASNG